MLKSKRWIAIFGFITGILAGFLGAAHGTTELRPFEDSRKVLWVDRIEDAWVVLEVGEGQRVDVPLGMFPNDLREGDGLVLVRISDARLDSARLRIERLLNQAPSGGGGR